MNVSLSVNTLNSSHASKVEFVQGNFRNLHKITQRYEYCGSRFLHGIRNNANFLSSSFIILDFDEKLSLEDGIKNFEDVISLCVTTKSHRVIKNGKVSDRFRVLLPIQKPIIESRHYKSLLRSITRYYNSDIACVDEARYFLPNPEQEVFYSNSSNFFDLTPFINSTESAYCDQKLLKGDKLFALPCNRIDLIGLLDKKVTFYRNGVQESETLENIINSSSVSDKAIACHCFLNPSHPDLHPSCFIYQNESNVYAKCSACQAEGILLNKTKDTTTNEK